MSHTEIFNKAIVLLNSVNKLFEEDEFISSCANTLSATANGLPFQVGTLLSVPYTDSGIYMIWADFSNWKNDSEQSWEELFSRFLDEWNTPTEPVLYFPKATKKSIKNAKNYLRTDMIPFYIGKAKNISERIINEHLDGNSTEMPYALKLNSRVDFLNAINFKITYLPLETDDDTYFVVERVEYLLRKKLKPLIGKQ